MTTPGSTISVAACPAERGHQLAPPREWQRLPSLAAKVLDDPLVGLLVIDPTGLLVHASSELFPFLGVYDGATKRGIGAGTLTAEELLAASELDSDSTSALRFLLSATAANRPTAGLLLTHKDGATRCWARVRDAEYGYKVANFEQPPGVRLVPEAGEYWLPDAVTGLADRRRFEKVGAELLSGHTPEPLAVLFIDLDRFKPVNDTLGHAAGDALLRMAGERLRSATRRSDIVARLGGDEFGILLHPVPPQSEIAAIAARILDFLQRTYLHAGQMINVGASIGIAVTPENGTDFPTLLRCADLALYQSKASGGATFCFFDEQMEKRAQARRAGELDLRRALALRQFEVYYQPQVNIATGRLVGFEALVRWRHPQRGLIPPSDFLPMAEQIGVLDAMGEWVLRTACKEATKWPSGVVIAVNVAPSQLHTGHFLETAKRALASSGLDGSRLEIEITETAFLKNEDTVLATLRGLQELNIKIAMDDFGTGFASLSQLARFPFDKVKIDRSLAGFAGASPKHRAIVRAVSALTASLGMSCIAEGVETQEQCTRLEEDGCGMVQGYLFGQPVPTTKLTELIDRLS